MTPEKARQIRWIYGLILSAALVLSGLCLMVQCVAIYNSGDQPFSRESVAAHFSPIATPVYVTLVLIPVGFLMNLFLPDSKEKRKNRRRDHMLLERLQAKKDLHGCSENIRAEILAQQKRRRRLNLLSVLIFTLCGAGFLFYGMDPANFHQTEINTSMIRAMWVLAPCSIAALAWGLWSEGKKARSVAAEIELWKQAPAGSVSMEVKARTGLIPWVILFAALALLILGACTGGTQDVLTKAVNICTECVGLG